MSEINDFCDWCDYSSSDEEPQNKVVGGNIFGDAYRGVARKAKSLGKSALNLREKIVAPIRKTRQKATRGVGNIVLGKERTKKLERYGDAVLYNTAGLPPSVKEILREYGNEPISKIVIVRTPVDKTMPAVMNAISLGSFNKKFGRLPYDKLFHLALFVTTAMGVFAMEKNEVIGITKNPANRPTAEFEEVSPIKQGVTMNDLMAGSEKILGKDRWTKYDAYSNNCQDFVMSLVKGGGMGSAQDFAFIKQDTDSLFKNDSFLRRFARNVTNLGASVATAKSGVDDKPINSKPVASDAKSSTFEIPTAITTDVQDAVGGSGKAKKKRKANPDFDEPYTAEDLEVARYLDPPAVYRDWGTMTKKEQREYLHAVDESGRGDSRPTPPRGTTAAMLKTNLAALHDRIGRGGATLKMPASRKKAVIKEALEYANGDLYRGYMKDPNHYLRAALAVR